jgi:hypothetical protein
MIKAISRVCFLLIFFPTPGHAQYQTQKSCIDEKSSVVGSMLEIAKNELRHHERFWKEYCVSRVEMNAMESKFTFARDVEFDPGTGPENIQKGVIEFEVVVDTKFKIILRAKENLRP